MGYNVKVSELAHGDIDETVTYIAETLQNKTAAIRFLDELDGVYENISQSPFMYELSRIPSLAKAGYRRAVVMNYVLMYLVEEENETVIIARLFYGGRDYAKYL